MSGVACVPMTPERADAATPPQSISRPVISELMTDAGEPAGREAIEAKHAAIDVEPRRLQPAPDADSVRYLRTEHQRFGHDLDLPAVR